MKTDSKSGEEEPRKAGTEKGKGKENKGDIIFGILLLFNTFVIEFIGFFASGSVTLLADSFYVLGEFLFFVSVTRLMEKRESLSPRISGFILLACGFLVTNMGIRRFYFPENVNGPVLLVFGIAGFVLTASVMRKVKERYKKGSREVSLHIIRKSLPSALVVASGAWIVLTGNPVADSMLSLVIGFLLIFEGFSLFSKSSFRVIRDEYVPDDI